LLEERERGAVEVEPQVRGCEGARQQHRQERVQAAGKRQSGALKDVEDVVDGPLPSGGP
jgi:hypothetical protein